MDRDVRRDDGRNKGWHVWLKRRVFVLYVNSNMLVCSIIFLPWALPRETVSGLLGRWKLNSGWKRSAAIPMAWIVDRIYFWEPNHCVEIARQELELRRNLYDDQSLHWP